MKTIKFLSMAALVVMGAFIASCAKEKDVDPVAEDNIVVCTTTVTLDADDTKALSIVGDKGVKTFAKDEQVALNYWNTGINQWDKALSQKLSVTDISADGKTATLTFTLTNPQTDSPIHYCYPAAMSDSYGFPDYTKLTTQNGKLASLSANLDLAIGDGNLSGTNLPAKVTLTNELAILAITLKTSDGSSDITSTITELTISDGTNTYTISRSASAGPIYVAILPVDNKNITITATRGLTKYTKSLTGKTYEAGNGYNVAWRMELTPLDLTNPSFGQVIGSDGKNYAYANLPSGVTAVAMIAYINGDHGLAIAMADENNDNYIKWDPAMAAAAAHAPKFSGGTWKIPRRDEWLSMFKPGTKYEQYLYNVLNTAIENAGGTPFPQKSYWTSTDGGQSNTKYIMTFNDGTYVIDGSYQGKELATIRARSCLAF